MDNKRTIILLFILFPIVGCGPSHNTQRHGPVLSPDEYALKEKQLRIENDRLRKDLTQSQIALLRLQVKAMRESQDPESIQHFLVRFGFQSLYHDVRLTALQEFQTLDIPPSPQVLKALHKMMYDTDSRIRAVSLNLIGTYDHKNKHADILRSVHDLDATVRAEAAKLLMHLNSEESNQALLILLNDRSTQVQIEAILAMTKKKKETSVVHLTSLMLKKGTSPQVIAKAIDALGLIEATSPLDTIVQFLSSPDQGVQWSAINAIGKIGSTQYAFHLIPFLAPQHPTHIRLVTIQSLSKLGYQEAKRHIDRMLHQDNDMSIRIEAAKYFIRAGNANDLINRILPLYLNEKADAVKNELWKATLAMTKENPLLSETIIPELSKGNQFREISELITQIWPLLTDDQKKNYRKFTGTILLPQLMMLTNDHSDNAHLFQTLNMIYSTSYTLTMREKALSEWKRLGKNP